MGGLDELLGKLTNSVDIAGTTIHFRPMTIEQVIQVEGLPDSEIKEKIDLVTEIVASCICTPDGTVTDNVEETLDKLRRIGIGNLQRIFEAIMNLTTLTDGGELSLPEKN